MRVLQGKGVSPGVNTGKPVNIERSLDFSVSAKMSLDEGIVELTSRYKGIVERSTTHHLERLRQKSLKRIS